MLVVAFCFMFIGLGSIALWLHLFLSEKEGNQNFFEKHYNKKRYHDFIKLLSIISAIVGTVVFAFLWYLIPVVWYGAYCLYKRFTKAVK